jgi:hypothetical protein
MSEGSIAGQDFQPRMRATVNKSDRTTGKKTKKVARKGEVNQVLAKVEKRWSKLERPKAQAIECRIVPAA